MDDFIKINNEEYFINEWSIQPSICNYANIYISINIEKYPLYESKFLKLYDNNMIFDISALKFIATGSSIKTIDITFGKRINIMIRCISLKINDVSEIRDQILDNILVDDKTLINKNNIINYIKINNNYGKK